MALKPLTIETLGKLDYGSAGLTINKALQTAVADLDNRAENDRRTRKVMIEIALTPCERLGEFDIVVTAQPKLPALQGAATRCGIGLHEKQPALFFQEGAPHDHRQRTLDEVEEKADES